MELYNFKEDFTNSVFRLMGRILLMTILIQIVVSLISYLGMSVFMPGLADFQSQMQSVAQSGDFEAMMEEMQGLAMNSDLLSPGGLTMVSIISIVLTLLTYNILFNGSRNEVEDNDNSLASAVRGIFDSRLLKYVVVYFLSIIGFFIVMFLLAMSQSGLLIFIGVVALLPIFLWFTLSYAAIGIGNYSIGESLKLTFSNLSFGRWAKVLGIGILAFIALLIVAVVVGLIASLIMKIPGVGPILGQIINSLISGALIAFIVAGFSGLFYRYTESAESEEQYIVTD